MAGTGGDFLEPIPDSNVAEELGRYAVDEYNRTNVQQTAALVFSRVVDGKQQAVSGLMYYLTIEAVRSGSSGTKLYQAKVWVRGDLRELIEFKPVKDSEPASSTSAATA